MPHINWNMSGRKLRDFDRSKQFAPYTGPVPPNAVYKFKVKVFKYVEATRDKWEQIRIGLELVPRNAEEQRFGGFFVMAFRALADNNEFTYVPFFDAIGVTDADWDRTIADEEGNIKKIGRWRHDGTTEILARLCDKVGTDDVTRKDVDWFGPVVAPEKPNYEDEDEDESGYYSVETDDDDYEEEPAPKRKASTSRRQSSRTRTASRRSRPVDDDEEPF